MKKCVLLLIIFSICVSCGDFLSRDGSVTGVYVKFSESEYSRAWDTIDIRVADFRRQRYLVSRRTGFQRMHADTLHPKESKTHQLIMQFEAGDRQLHDADREHIYFFHESFDTLYNRHSAYHKIR